MAEQKTLQDLFVDELRDVYDAERQLLKALPKMAKAATAGALTTAFEKHLAETQAQVTRLEQVFDSIDEKARGKHCDGMAGLLDEGKAVMEEDFDEATLDAALIGAAQRVEHYEMAAYGVLVAWARLLGHEDAAVLLEQTLEEEKAADEKLTTLAEGGINQAALDAMPAESADRGEDEEDEGKLAMSGARSSTTGKPTGRPAQGGAPTKSRGNNRR